MARPETLFSIHAGGRAVRQTALNQCSSGQQNWERRLVQDRARDATEHPLSQLGVAIGAHDEEISAESGSLRQQKLTHVFSAGRQALYFHLRVVTRQVAGDVRPRLLAVTRPVALMIDDQDLDRLGLHKQWQSVRHGADRLARGIPRYEDAADLRYRAARWKHDDGATGA